MEPIEILIFDRNTRNTRGQYASGWLRVSDSEIKENQDETQLLGKKLQEVLRHFKEMAS